MFKIINFGKILRNSIKLDIYDFNYAFSSEKLDLLSINTFENKRVGIFWRIISFLFHMITQSYNDLSKRSFLKSGKVLLFCVTENQRNAIVDLRKKINGSFLGGGSQFSSIDVEARFPIGIAYLLSFPFFPLVVYHFINAEGYKRKSFRYIFDQYWLTFGYYITAQIWLKRLQINTLVVSNDHNMPNRVMTKTANIHDISTVYIQHSSVTKCFPPLIFDYALLDGMDSLEKYEIVGNTNTTVFLVGMLRMDRYVEFVNNNNQVENIGVCINTIDPSHKVKELLIKLTENFDYKRIHFRPHPRDTRKTWTDFSNAYNLSLSTSDTEDSLVFLRKVDVIISGDSNIILEAALMNVYPLYYDFSGKKLDWYGFIKNNLVDHFLDIEELIAKINELEDKKPNIRHKAKRYSSTINTKFDGCSVEIILEIISSLKEGNKIDMSNWIQIPYFDIEAYLPREEI